ncbi:hypothetical protein P9112_013017 [Eukaryota sp. TZLM1-RC]
MFQLIVALLLLSSFVLCQSLNFANYDWYILDSPDNRMYPGSNFFDASMPYVDENGHLHLSIVNNGTKWYCSEIFSKLHFGYGTYTFEVDDVFAQHDRNVMLSFYIHQGPVEEFAVEFGLWGRNDFDNSCYTVQPNHLRSNYHEFDTTHHNKPTIHSLTWSRDKIEFSSSRGSIKNAEEYQSWEYDGEYRFPPSEERMRIALWLYKGNAPTDDKDYEVIIRNFVFTPLEEPNTTVYVIIFGALTIFALGLIAYDIRKRSLAREKLRRDLTREMHFVRL